MKARFTKVSFGCALFAIMLAAGVIANCGGSSSGGGGGGGGGGASWVTVYTDPGGGGGTIKCLGDDCQLAGEFFSDLTLENGNTNWLLSGFVFIGDDTNPADLTIEPGTVIRGLGGTPPGTLTIRRNATIHAIGTANNPIVFTSSKDPGARARGDWGGIVINGNAVTNACNNGLAGCLGDQAPEGEGSSGPFGGNDDSDDSGHIEYVRVEFAGHVFSSSDELNGIAFQGVGSGTTIRNIQVHMNKDDGVEMFGGNAHMKNVLITGCADDSFDWTQGWRGKAQNVIIQHFADDADQGIEADNLDSGHDNLPRAMPLLANFTIIGSPESSKSDMGVLFRHGTGAKMYNSVIMGFNDANLDIDSQSTWDNAYTSYSAPQPSGAFVSVGPTLSGNLVFENNTMVTYPGGGIQTEDDEDEDDDSSVDDPLTISTQFVGIQTGNSLLEGETVIEDAFNENSPDFRPVSGGNLTSQGVTTMSGIDAWFDDHNRRGALGENAGDDWTTGWTTHAHN